MVVKFEKAFFTSATLTHPTINTKFSSRLYNVETAFQNNCTHKRTRKNIFRENVLLLAPGFEPSNSHLLAIEELNSKQYK